MPTAIMDDTNTVIDTNRPLIRSYEEFIAIGESADRRTRPIKKGTIRLPHEGYDVQVERPLDIEPSKNRIIEGRWERHEAGKLTALMKKGYVIPTTDEEVPEHLRGEPAPDTLYHCPFDDPEEPGKPCDKVFGSRHVLQEYMLNECGCIGGQAEDTTTAPIVGTDADPDDPDDDLDEDEDEV